jgi:hypothetical protein
MRGQNRALMNGKKRKKKKKNQGVESDQLTTSVTCACTSFTIKYEETVSNLQDGTCRIKEHFLGVCTVQNGY